jgi:hypothetical protein
MSVTLKLKNRPVENRAFLPMVALQEIFKAPEADAKDALYTLLEKISESPQSVHDKKHLLAIVNWQPKGGLSLSERAKWFKLVERVNALDDKKEGNFTLSTFQATLVCDRLKDDKFKLAGRQFDEFAFGFMATGGFHFAEEDPDVDDAPDNDGEKAKK